MKGSYHRSSTKFHVKRIVVVGFLVVVFILLTRSLVVGGVATVNQTVFETSSWVQDFTQLMPQHLKDKIELQNEITRLESELARASGDRLTIESLVAENIELRAMLGASSTARVLANVIGRPPQLPHDAVLVDVGSIAGVEAGAPVYIGRDQAIGIIAEVYPHSAIAVLVSSPGVESTVFVLGPDIYTTAVGQGGGVLQVNVPQGVSLKQSDLVLLPALGAGVYGEIVEVVSVPTEPVQYGFVTTDVGLQHVRHVTVGTGPQADSTFAEAAEAVATARLELLRVDVPADVLTAAPTSTATGTDEITELDIQ